MLSLTPEGRKLPSVAPVLLARTATQDQVWTAFFGEEADYTPWFSQLLCQEKKKKRKEKLSAVPLPSRVSRRQGVVFVLKQVLQSFNLTHRQKSYFILF